MDIDTNTSRRMYAAVQAGDTTETSRILSESPIVLGVEVIGTWLHMAARLDDVPIMALLVECGLDVNRAARNGSGTPLTCAASRGSFRAAAWLLEHGANVDAGTPLISATISGHLEMVQFLVAHGADINALDGAPPRNALNHAMSFGHKEIEGFLRSMGAIASPAKEPARGNDEIWECIESSIGPVSRLAVPEIPSDLELHLDILLVGVTEDHPYLTLITSGMSAEGIQPPQASGEGRYPEIVIHLPGDWPLSEQALEKPENFWPIEWLHRTAYHPYLTGEWLSHGHVLTNGDPPEPFAPNTAQSSLLVLRELYLDPLRANDGTVVHFYDILALYKEECDIHARRGLNALLRLFQEHRVPITVAPTRLNVGSYDG